MIVGIDVSRYGHSESTGVEWYSYHLLNELFPMLGRDHNAEVRLYSPHDFIPAVELPFNVHKYILPFKKYWTLIRLSYEMLVKPVDRLFVPSHMLPLVVPKKSVITIHDVAFKKIPEVYDKKQFRMLDWSTKRAVKKAWRIIVPSTATKQDLVDLYGCDEKKIRVIFHGAPRLPVLHQWKDAEKKEMFERFKLNERDLVILFVGRLEAKKNLVRLVEAFSRFSKEYPGWKLFLAGKPGVGFDLIEAKIKELGLEKDVVMPGYITEAEKMFLYEKCRMVAFPSLYEGFGLPVLEAFAHRRPILTSRVSSMPEVAGNAAYLINPEKVEEIGVGLKRLASDGMMVSQLIGKQEAQLKKFDWEKAAQQTFDVLFE